MIKTRVFASLLCKNTEKVVIYEYEGGKDGKVVLGFGLILFMTYRFLYDQTILTYMFTVSTNIRTIIDIYVNYQKGNNRL